MNRLEESLGCASLAVRIHRAGPALLELALSEWARARFEETDEKYVARLRRAEELFGDKLLGSNELAQLSLTRFYRLTFRPLDACEKFDYCIANTGNMRRLLRDSYIFSEAAIQLWYAKYPEDLLRKHLCHARSLLESALAAGYQNARILTSLAFTRAILEDAKAGNSVLSEIHRENLSVSWDEAMKLAAQVGQSEPLELGFVLGLNQSAVWTILGTYSLKFLDDPYLTEVLYRTAIRLDRHNPVALTNLARFLVRRGTQESLTEAGRLLQKAQNFADRRFTWWRVVLAELETLSVLRPKKDVAPRSVRDIPVAPKQFVNLKQLRDHFRRVEQLEDLQQRGYELENLVYEAARLTFGMAVPAYRCDRDSNGRIRQIDGYFEQPPEEYRVECKWQAGRSEHADILLFGDRLNVVGVSGLFISMSGFAPSAEATAKQLSATKAILLMDGDEVARIFKGQMNFDTVMRTKRLYFNLKSEVYHRVVPTPVAA